MKSNYKRLGDLIENINLRNEQKQVSKLLGVNLEKQLIPSIANIVGTDLSTYKIIKKGQFACKLMSVGRDGVLPVGYLADYDEAIVSPAYYVFQVKEEDLLLPEFLMLCMKRNEFDRELWFSSGGDVRGGATWENLNEIMIPVPPIEEQEKIVDAYETIEKRIALKRKINDNLEATALAYFNNLFLDGSKPNCTLADIALVNPIRQLTKGTEARCFDMATLPTSGGIPTGDAIKPYNGGVRFINGDTLIARITPCLENGKAAYINILSDNEVAFGSTEYIVFAAKDNMPSSFYYFLIRNTKFVTFALQFMNGSSGRQRVSGEELASFPLVRPSAKNLAVFEKVGAMVLEQMKANTNEIQKLQQLQEIIVATMLRR